MLVKYIQTYHKQRRLGWAQQMLVGKAYFLQQCAIRLVDDWTERLVIFLWTSQVGCLYYHIDGKVPVR